MNAYINCPSIFIVNFARSFLHSKISFDINQIKTIGMVGKSSECLFTSIFYLFTSKHLFSFFNHFNKKTKGKDFYYGKRNSCNGHLS